ncbi:MAG: FIST C-terminal domain-containing protein [Magnetospirillum sp. WYHS-4]
MTLFRSSHAAADDWAHAAKACADGLLPLPSGANLGFVYATDHLAADLGSVLTYLKQKTGIADWVGSVGLGIMGDGTEYFDELAVAAMVGAFPPGSYRLFQSLAKSVDELPAAERAWMKAAPAAFALVHADPSNPQAPDLVRQLAEAGDAFLVGGMTSSREATLQVANRLTGGGLSGILFAPEVGVATGLSQGCSLLGQSHVVTDALDDILMGLDGRPALDVLRDDAGTLMADDPAKAAMFLHLALPVEGSDTADYLVRNIGGIDPVRGWLRVGAHLRAGDRMRFARRDSASAAQDLAHMAEKVMKRAGGKARGAVYVSCLGRGARMFGEHNRELAILRSVLGDVPLVGFAAGGEIFAGRLYGYTGVLSLFV